MIASCVAATSSAGNRLAPRASSSEASRAAPARSASAAATRSKTSGAVGLLEVPRGEPRQLAPVRDPERLRAAARPEAPTDRRERLARLGAAIGCGERLARATRGPRDAAEEPANPWMPRARARSGARASGSSSRAARSSGARLAQPQQRAAAPDRGRRRARTRGEPRGRPSAAPAARRPARRSRAAPARRASSDARAIVGQPV